MPWDIDKTNKLRGDCFAVGKPQINGQLTSFFFGQLISINTGELLPSLFCRDQHDQPLLRSFDLRLLMFSINQAHPRGILNQTTRHLQKSDQQWHRQVLNAYESDVSFLLDLFFVSIVIFAETIDLCVGNAPFTNLTLSKALGDTKFIAVATILEQLSCNF